MAEQLYFAYGSNMNLDQMEFRCPAAVVKENVRLDGYRLAFCGKHPGCGVATILPEQGSHVDGVLWKITPECEHSLDRYEGYPYLYGKEAVCVQNEAGESMTVMVYVMKENHAICTSAPSQVYLKGILEGCRQNGIPMKNVKDAVQQARVEERAKFKKEEVVRMKASCDGEKTGSQCYKNRKNSRER